MPLCAMDLQMRFVLFGEVFLMTGDKDLADARTNRKKEAADVTATEWHNKPHPRR